ncbi:MAG: hypothetical protein GTO18_10220 [Anaerolineales bacterium]|nr:hypothetical protein [Anaerolineales bacterium]
MPVFRSGFDLAPDWCELEYFEIVSLNTGEAHSFERLGASELLFVAEGECRIQWDDQELLVIEAADFELTSPTGNFEVTEVLKKARLVRLCGRWGEEIGGYGLFTYQGDEPVPYEGDPVDYEKTTKFDRHFHDCDEYWIIIEGRGIAVSEGKAYEIGPGDCVATGKGYHHDLPHIFERIKGIYFETTLEGEKRLGHLWEHTHGEPDPDPNRV